MNLQQLEYIIAVDECRHFAKAANLCFVTQATLSMMIKKLEKELDIILFDRSKQPVIPTEAGKLIIEQARIVLREVSLLKQLPKISNNDFIGELRIGIIPTSAPYLLPLCLPFFLKKYPNVKLRIQEQNTEQLLQLLTADKLDAGIMATPTDDKSFQENHLFYEAFKIYVSENEKVSRKKYILPEEIDINRLWLLEEGHCLRSQILNLCELQKKQADIHNLDYETGSIESLLKITEMNQGVTIIPELAAISFNQKQKERLWQFKSPVPVREISLVTYRHFVKKPLLDVFAKEITENILPYLSEKNQKNRVIPI